MPLARRLREGASISERPRKSKGGYAFSVSATTRPIRQGEIDGRDGNVTGRVGSAHPPQRQRRRVDRLDAKTRAIKNLELCIGLGVVSTLVFAF